MTNNHVTDSLLVEYTCITLPMDANDMSSTKKCTKPWCKRTLPLESRNRTCEHCRHHDKENQRASRARQKDAKAQRVAVGPLVTYRKRPRDPRIDKNPEERPAVRQRTGHEPVSDQTHTTTPGDDDDDDEEFGQEPDEKVSEIIFLTKSDLHVKI